MNVLEKKKKSQSVYLLSISKRPLGLLQVWGSLALLVRKEGRTYQGRSFPKRSDVNIC